MALVIASAPNWTDKAMVAITAVGFLLALMTLRLGLKERRQQTDELRRQTALATAQRARELMAMLTDLGRVFVERPDLKSYFGTNADPPPGSTVATRVEAHAVGYMNLAEAVGWQIAAEQMVWPAAVAWRNYFFDLYWNTPALKSIVGTRWSMLAKETRWLLGVGRAPDTVRRLEADARRPPQPPRDWVDLFLVGGFWLLFFGLLVPVAIVGYWLGAR